MPIFPIWFNDGTLPEPDKKTFYQIAKNGIFINKKNQFWRAVVPVERISILKECSPSFETFLPPIPSEITIGTTRFFAYVASRMHAESMVLLWWDVEKNIYSVSVPPQIVDDAGIKYSNPINPGYVLIGTIHSHAHFPAGHSGIDHKDEEFFDGIHGTFGGFSRDSNNFQISLQASINNSRFILDPIDFFEGIKSLNPVEELGSENSGIIYGRIQEGIDIASREDFSWFSGDAKNNEKIHSTYYSLKDGELIPKGYKPPEEWTSAVKKKQFNFSRLFKGG